ncbi:TetR/AcrR family transcriptional regulator [Thermodesulfobacteriota bacterium]
MGIAERKQREKEARIESIKKSARRLFARKGFGSTSMEEIAESAEISKGSIYLSFKSKAELAYSLMEPILETHYNLLAQLTDNNKEAADKTLRKLVDFFFEAYGKDPEPYQFFMFYKAEDFQSLLTEDRLGDLKNLMSKNLKTIENVISRGVMQGIFKPVNPKLTSIVVWNIILGILQFEENRTYGGGKDHLKPTLIAAISLVLNGLKV